MFSCLSNMSMFYCISAYSLQWLETRSNSCTNKNFKHKLDDTPSLLSNLIRHRTSHEIWIILQWFSVSSNTYIMVLLWSLHSSKNCHSSMQEYSRRIQLISDNLRSAGHPIWETLQRSTTLLVYPLNTNMLLLELLSVTIHMT